MRLCTPLIAVAFVARTGSGSALAKRLTLCEVLSHPAAWDEKIIRFESEYRTTPEDFPAMFMSKDCHGFIEDITRDVGGDQSVRSLDRAMNGLPQTFIVEVSGKFHWQKNWKPPSALLSKTKPHPQGQLEVTHVWWFLERR